MSIKNQLRAYYAKQDLTGKHRRKAMQWDMKQVKAELKRRPLKYQPDNLMYIHWGSMPETKHLYWANRHCGTGT